MASPRRVGAETSKTRDLLLDTVEQTMLDEGYAAVTYRCVAARAGVTSGLVQYYFPTADDMFTAAIRRRAVQSLAQLTEALDAHPDRPLHVLWDYSRDEETSALMTEFLALGNHRKSIHREIADAVERVRQVQLEAVQRAWLKSPPGEGHASPAVVLFMTTAIPWVISLERTVGVTMAHAEVVKAFEVYVETVEPTAP